MDDTKTYSFADVLVAPEHVMCSVQLYPFALGHWTFLELYGSPLLSESLYPDDASDDPVENFKHCIRHILLFLLVCGHTYEDNVRMYNDQSFFDQEKDLFEKNIEQYIKSTTDWNIYAEIFKIKEYLNYYINSMPMFVEKGPPAPPSGVDWKINIYSVFKNEYGYTQLEIMNMSMKRVFAEWVTFAAKSGAVMIKSKQQLIAEDNARIQAEEYAKKMKEQKGQT